MTSMEQAIIEAARFLMYIKMPKPDVLAGLSKTCKRVGISPERAKELAKELYPDDDSTDEHPVQS